MSDVNILFGFCILFLAAIVWLMVKLVATSDELYIEKCSHRITIHHLENQRNKQP